MDDHWNFYYRSGPGIGTWGAAITRGDVLVRQAGKYVDIDNLNLSADEESQLLQQRMPGVSSGVSGGSFIFVAGVATSVDGETMTVEGGFGLPPSPIAAFWAPESGTDPWFSWR